MSLPPRMDAIPRAFTNFVWRCGVYVRLSPCCMCSRRQQRWILFALMPDGLPRISAAPAAGMCFFLKPLSRLQTDATAWKALMRCVPSPNRLARRVTPRSGRFLLALGAWIEQRGWRQDVSSDNLAALAAPVIAFANAALSKRHAKMIKL